MRWTGRDESSNVEDRRGMRMVGMGGGAGLLITLVAMFFGVDPGLLSQLAGPALQREEPRQISREENQRASFTKVILRDTEVVWNDLFRQAGRSYQEPTLVLFSGGVRSACGMANAAVGPFYCPGDQKVYIDLDFYKDMERKLNSPGEFARAYVIAHEVGHHVQHIAGWAGRGRMSNRQTVRMELQADYLAGVWAHHGQKRFSFLEQGDVDSALKAAFEIGDDNLQRKSQGYVVPDSFTHGTSQQRMAAFTDGLNSGDFLAARRFLETDFAVR
jgi:predicted metalloprotease